MLLNRPCRAPAHAPRAGYRQALPDPSSPYPGAFTMVAMIVRFIEELIDVFNFGSNISK